MFNSQSPQASRGSLRVAIEALQSLRNQAVVGSPEFEKYDEAILDLVRQDCHQAAAALYVLDPLTVRTADHLIKEFRKGVTDPVLGKNLDRAISQLARAESIQCYLFPDAGDSPDSPPAISPPLPLSRLHRALVKQFTREILNQDEDSNKEPPSLNEAS